MCQINYQATDQGHREREYHDTNVYAEAASRKLSTILCRFIFLKFCALKVLLPLLQFRVAGRLIAGMNNQDYATLLRFLTKSIDFPYLPRNGVRFRKRLLIASLLQ